MSKQSSLHQYFRSKCSQSSISTMSDKNISKKRRSLSLVKPLTPAKCSKLTHTSQNCIEKENEVVDLCSENENSPSKSNGDINISQSSVNSEASSSSRSTLLYNLTPRTPQKSPQVSSGRNPSLDSREKYFSPTKKRGVLKKSPVKRNLAQQYYNSTQSMNCGEDADLNKTRGEMDDKTYFLLTIIKKCVMVDNLKKLLDQDSAELLNACLHVVKPGARLICRLYWRQHTWYRRDQLVTITNDKRENINDSQFQEMLNCLLTNNIVTASTISGSMTFDDYTKILKRDELKQVCQDLKIKFQSKQGAVDALLDFSKKSSISKFFNGGNSDNSKRVMNIMRSKAGTCYKLSDLAISCLYKLYLIMYLGMNYEAIREKRLELILINDKIKRETYPVDKEMVVDDASVVFKSPEEFEKYLKAHMMYENFLSKTATTDKCKIVIEAHKLYKNIHDNDMNRYQSLALWLRRFTPAYLYIKIMEAGIQDLKKTKKKEHILLALELLDSMIKQMEFRPHKKANWYAEKALILHNEKKHDEAANVLLEGLKSNLSEEAKDALRPRAKKLANLQNIRLAPGLAEALIELGSQHLALENTFSAAHVSKQAMETSKQRGKKKFEIHTENEKTFLEAEEYCIKHYLDKGEFTHGRHWEGRIITTTFFLLFWDIIYAKPSDVEGIYLSHYQLHPLDFHTNGFYQNRRSRIDDRLNDIQNMHIDMLLEEMSNVWNTRPEHEISGINRSMSWSEVSAVCECLGGARVAAVCRRLAAHYVSAHAGFPDLTLWDERTKKIKFVEVKTDSDKPSIKQLQWMKYLRDNDIDTEFCYVGVCTERCRARAPPAASAPSAPSAGLQVRTVADINRDTDRLAEVIKPTIHTKHLTHIV